jgi:hypothetical protein
VGNLLEVYRGGGLTGTTCPWQGARGTAGGEGHRQAVVGVTSVDGRVGEQNTAGAELVGGSTGPRSDQGKMTLAGCLVKDRADGGKITGVPEELPCLPDGAPAQR